MTQKNLNSAANQWANRKADERYWCLESLMAAAKAKKARMKECPVRLDGMRFVPLGEDGIVVRGPKGHEVQISNLAFEQMAARVDFSASALTKLNPELACEVLNYRLDKTLVDDPDVECQILFDEGEDITIRSITSTKYARVPDADILHFPMKLKELGWKVPPSRPAPGWTGPTKIATEADVLQRGEGGIQVRVGDTIGPGGLYMGDRNLFVFMVNDRDAVDDGMGNALLDGVIIQNSEVGKSNFSVTRFTTQGVCGNHIIWNASNIVNVKHRHIGQAYDRIQGAIEGFVHDKPKDWTRELAVIDFMRKHTLGPAKDDVIEVIYGFRENALTKKVLNEAYNLAEANRDTDGDPNSLYGITNGITRASQNAAFADERHEIDTAVGKIYDRAAKMMK